MGTTRRHRKKSDHAAAKIAKALLQGKSQTHAVMAAGYSRSVAEARSGEIIRLPEVQSLLTAAMQKATVSVDELARTLKAALGATIVMVTKNGAIDTGLPDHATRLKAFDLAARAFGFLQPRNAQPDPTPPPAISFTVNFVTPKPRPGETGRHQGGTTT